MGVDDGSKFAWGENVGWLNAAPTGTCVTAHFDGTAGWLSGFAWGENVGWIKFGANAGGPYANTLASNWGVNMSAAGVLSGYAWGENIGWIKFDAAFGGVTVDTASGRFSGQAWSENVGWLSFSGTAPDYGVRTLAFDAQPLGTPNWWLDHFGVTEASDEGDGVPAADEYVADTNPNDPASYLRIVSVSNAPSSSRIAFVPSSTRRYYTLLRRPNLDSGAWTSVSGQEGVPGTGGGQVMQDASPAPQMFYRVRVSVAP
jgi:hypothetical protein